MEMSKKLCKDSVGMWSRIWIIWRDIFVNKKKKEGDLLWEEKISPQRIL